ncbi:hypothetical protein GCM10011351_31110 [Paraliobacillus quinghaiensis]|uniref:Uncharacterized protein n=1 Tax=Paraliobacillus quinghaiensis TaxID=470815 RepID=A0A917TXY0_9BACI|nr:hypothetical protein [Paraliobacillus quinghaiensis]GGM42944.1 hypothetical protein GCM10011351_31110 [Paraliobacillus quinghaiensis]
MIILVVLIGSVASVVMLSMFLSPILVTKTGVEIILFSILLVLTGFFLYYWDPNNLVGLIGFSLVIFGLVSGVSSFLFKRN